MDRSDFFLFILQKVQNYRYLVLRYIFKDTFSTIVINITKYLTFSLILLERLKLRNTRLPGTEKENFSRYILRYFS